MGKLPTMQHANVTLVLLAWLQVKKKTKTKHNLLILEGLFVSFLAVAHVKCWASH